MPEDHPADVPAGEPPDVEEDLGAELRADDADRRRAAARTLHGHAGERPELIVRELASLVVATEDDDRTVRGYARAAIGRVEEGWPDPDIRRERLGAVAERAVANLTAASPGARREAAGTYRWLASGYASPGPGGAQALLDRLGDDDRVTRRSAAAACYHEATEPPRDGVEWTPAAEGALLDATEDADARVRGNALAALATCRDGRERDPGRRREDLAALARGMTDDDPAVRQTAVSEFPTRRWHRAADGEGPIADVVGGAGDPERREGERGDGEGGTDDTEGGDGELREAVAVGLARCLDDGAAVTRLGAARALDAPTIRAHPDPDALVGRLIELAAADEPGRSNPAADLLAELRESRPDLLADRTDVPSADDGELDSN